MTSTAAILIALVMVSSMLAVLSIAMVSGAAASNSGATPAVTALSAGSPSPGPVVKLDLGQSVFLNAAASGGTPPYYYSWYSEPAINSVCGVTVGSILLGSGDQTTVYNPPAGDTYVCFNVQDSVGATSTSTTDTVVVSSAALTAGALTYVAAYCTAPATPVAACSGAGVATGSPTVDTGQTMTFIANPAGGTPPYTLSWYSAPATGACTLTQIAGQTGSELNTTPSPSSINYCYKVSDSAVGFPTTVAVTSAQTGVTLDAALVAGAVTPKAPYGDAGGTQFPVLLTSHVSGGTGAGYTYQWYSGTSSAACSALTAIPGATTPTYSITTLSVSTFYCYTASDPSTASTATGHPIIPSTVMEYEINATLAAAPITTPYGAPALDMGTLETVNLTANPSGGSGLGGLPGYDYSWTAGVYPTCGLDVTPVAHGPHVTGWDATVAAGSLYYCYSVTDGNSSAPAASANGLLVTVYPALVSNTPTPGTPTIDLGRAVTLSATPTGGTGTYVAYQWYQETWTGTACSTTPNTLLVGATSATYSAASGPMTPMTAVGNYCFGYTVQDNSNGTQAMETSSLGPGALVTVDPALVADTPLVHSQPGLVLLTAPFYVDATQEIELTAQPSGGTMSTTYVYQWYFGSSAPTATGCSGSALAGDTSVSVNVTPTATGFYCYTLTDGSVNAPTVANGTLVSWNATLTAGAITAPGTVVDFQTVNPNVDVNLTANPAGGTAPYLYTWSYGIVGVGPSSALCSNDIVTATSGAAGFSAAFAPGVPGLATLQTIEVDPTVSTYYCYIVTDSANTAVTVPLAGAFLIQVAPVLVANPAVSSAATMDVGQSAVITAIPSGGTGVYVSYQWFLGSNAACGAPGLIASAFAQTYVFSPTVGSVGGTSYFFCYRATDSSYGDLAQRSGTGITATAVTVKVYDALVAGAPTGTPGFVAPTTLGAAPSGGLAPYTYQWYTGPSSVCSLDSAIFGANLATYAVAASTGQYFCYGLTDSNGATQLSPTAFVT